LIQIKDRADFKDKLGFVLAANTALISAGAPASTANTATLIDCFLNQFDEVRTDIKGLALGGFVVVDVQTRLIPFDFKDKLYPTLNEAVDALANYSKIRPYIKDGYGIRTVYL
jgi:hypothetical protein